MVYIRKITQFPLIDDVNAFLSVLQAHGNQCMETEVPVKFKVEKADEPGLDHRHPIFLFLYFKTEDDRDRLYPQKASEFGLGGKWAELVRNMPGLPSRVVENLEEAEDAP